MTIEIKEFLGTVASILEDRLYDPEEGLWLKLQSDGRIAAGLTQPAVLMSGTIRNLVRLIDQGTTVTSGETVLLGLTARLKYIACPISGVVTFPDTDDDQAVRVMEDPYNTPLFFVESAALEEQHLSSPPEYADFLCNSEGTRNPKGLKGGVSPTCKAVYMGLGQQNLDE